MTPSVYEDSKGGRKPDLSPPPSPVKPPLKPVSCVGSRGGDKRRPSNGLLDIQPQTGPNPRDTFSVFGEKQMSDVDAKNDTMELLKEAEMQNPKLEEEKATAFSSPERKSTHRSKMENIGGAVDISMDNKNDTVTLLKRAQTQHPHTSDVQVSADNDKSVVPHQIFLSICMLFLCNFMFL